MPALIEVSMIFLRFTCFLCLFFSNFIEAQEVYYANESVVDVKELPNENAEIGTQIVYGSPLTVLHREEPWLKIKAQDGYLGWVKEGQLAVSSKPYPSTSQIAQVNILWTHLYPEEDTAIHSPTITLPFGVKVEVLSDEDSLNKRWMRVRLIDGSEAFAQTEDFQFNPSLLSLKEMLTLSKKFLGLPYLWGGSSSFGFDCSGFTQMLFRQMGIHLPRNSSQQAVFSQSFEVAQESLKPGDLVFFNKKKPKVNHVGIYLGNDEFIQSVTTNLKGPHVIQISRLSDPEWQEQLVSIRRVETKD